MKEKIIKIRVLCHQTTGLLMATSEDIAGLVVHGRSNEELEKKIPLAVRDLLQASGFTVAD